ncbi:hypothetical protein CAPTEDRAFT_143979 [Capitella teleta]|uniref:Fucosyltransferase n=1 Tax=Capitella teleta TaxID=283909 RepID=R7UFC8_CAPTE|nr:hypothetical protein CAPTEDRAFT_143979 [Capitella teleta]|eukprot:ELU01962.1 hypothetical protein CAPTEDRAFT_143979 [Capitella teleta]
MRCTKSEICLAFQVRYHTATVHLAGLPTINVTTPQPKSLGSHKPFLLLLWTRFLANKPKWFDSPTGVSLMEKCYYKGVHTDQNCEYTTDRTRLLEADAVLFRARLLSKKDLPRKRLPHQKYIVFENEPPHKTWLYVNLTDYNSYFNLTATIAWDSDIPVNSHRRYIPDWDKFAALSRVNFTAKKRHDVPVAWFVSTCPTQSKREVYVKEMQRYIRVDVYGDCGTKKCVSKEVSGFSTDTCVWNLLDGSGSYKFYLAFENSLCEDYVTEKLWKVMKPNVVPIVMGAVDYGAILPTGSYIDVRDFHSPRHLAWYLNYLNRNPEAYNNYLRHKGSLKLSRKFMPRECIFCKRLHELNGQTSIVYGLDAFWSSRRCIEPEVFNSYRDLTDFGVDLNAIR